MNHSHASETAIRVAAMRAVHQLVDDDPKVLADPVAVGLIRAASEEALRAEAATHQDPAKRHLRANFVLRSRFAEDRLEEAVRRGVRQYVVLGAGLDTFAYRQPRWADGLATVEIDHPASQQFKITSLERASVAVPNSVSYFSIDFGIDDIATKLATAPLDEARPIFVSWLGVTQYVTREAALGTLKALTSWAGGCEIALTYIDQDWTSLPPDERAAMKIGETRAAASGEPWISKYSACSIADLLSSSGFSCAEQLSIAGAKARYFNNRSDGLAPSGGIGLAYARA